MVSGKTSDVEVVRVLRAGTLYSDAAWVNASTASTPLGSVAGSVRPSKNPGSFNRVRDAERQRAARAAFADHACDDRHRRARHQFQVMRDRLDLPALFGADARLCALRVDQRDNRQAEALG